MPQIFGAPTATDGIMMGHQGMRYSLVSREVIADSLEVVAAGMNHDGLLAFGGCDKNMPGCVMAMARAQRPEHLRLRRQHSARRRPGRRGRRHRLDLRSGRPIPGRQIDEKKLHKIECESCPGAGSCGGMYTANTMSSAIEAMGMSLPYRRQLSGRLVGQGTRIVPGREALVNLIAEKHPAARHHHPEIAGKRLHVRVGAGRLHQRGPAFDGDRARSGVSNGRLQDFDRLGDKVPHLADLKPGGKYVMFDLHRAGGTPPVLRALLDAGFLHGDCITVTGKTLAENLKDVPSIYAKPAERDQAAR